MKRIGFLFEKAFTLDALYQAWEDASKGKKNKRATLEFGRHLAYNLNALYTELHAGTYTPRPYFQFTVYEPKRREIFAPAFRDLVVQHAIYRLTYPIFNKTFIDQSFACRKGKGTHAASDYAQQALRSSELDSYFLQLDIRKFFYRIDRGILRTLIERKIKDLKFVDIMMLFADYGKPVGIPIGNLLSQMYALIYLDPLDHFIKRKIKARRYCRYVDDFVIFGISREECKNALINITKFIKENLNLELSRFTIQKVSKGINFVGYRAWRSTRFIRKHSLYTFRKSAKHNKLESIISILGHAMHTASFNHLLTILKGNYHAIFNHIPSRCKSAHHIHIKTTRCTSRRTIGARTLHPC